MAQPGPSEQPPQEPPGQGFRDALDALTERRYRELRGPWARAPERLRRAEGGRRARNEMARRIAQHTGRRRVSPRTIARRARQDAAGAGLLSDEIVMQIIVPRWNLPPTYSLDYRIEELLKFLPDV